MLMNTPVPYRPRRGRIKPPAAPPAAQVHVASVNAGDHAADWNFDVNIVAVLDISGLKINGASPTGVLEVAGGTLRVSYAGAIDVDEPWSYSGAPAVATFANGGALQPGSGTTQEG